MKFVPNKKNLLVLLMALFIVVATIGTLTRFRACGQHRSSPPEVNTQKEPHTYVGHLPKAQSETSNDEGCPGYCHCTEGSSPSRDEMNCVTVTCGDESAQKINWHKTQSWQCRGANCGFSSDTHQCSSGWSDPCDFSGIALTDLLREVDETFGWGCPTCSVEDTPPGPKIRQTSYFKHVREYSTDPQVCRPSRITETKQKLDDNCNWVTEYSCSWINNTGGLLGLCGYWEAEAEWPDPQPPSECANRQPATSW